MKDMSTRKNKVFGTGIMLAMLLAAFASFAQDAVEEEDDLNEIIENLTKNY